MTIPTEETSAELRRISYGGEPMCLVGLAVACNYNQHPFQGSELESEHLRAGRLRQHDHHQLRRLFQREPELSLRFGQYPNNQRGHHPANFDDRRYLSTAHL